MRKHSAISTQITCEVAFADVDLAQVVWHGHYLRYLENARWALMRLIGRHHSWTRTKQNSSHHDKCR